MTLIDLISIWPIGCRSFLNTISHYKKWYSIAKLLVRKLNIIGMDKQRREHNVIRIIIRNGNKWLNVIKIVRFVRIFMYGLSDNPNLQYCIDRKCLIQIVQTPSCNWHRRFVSKIMYGTFGQSEPSILHWPKVFNTNCSNSKL